MAMTTKAGLGRFVVLILFVAIAAAQAGFVAPDRLALHGRRREVARAPTGANKSHHRPTWTATRRPDRSSWRRHARPQNSLVAGLAEIAFGFSLGVLWSEYSILLTGCGPLHFSDALERVCYQGTVAAAGAALFHRIVAGGRGLDESAVVCFGPLEDFTLVQVRAAECASAVAVLGAFVALAAQYARGANMDGLSGIDVSLCRALRDL